MKVRVLQARRDYWLIQVWRWWWPVWRSVDYALSFDKAKEIADNIKNPTILEVQ